MTSLYDALFDDIPMFVVPGTENSDVIQYETNEQRNVRLINERKVKQTLEDAAGRGGGRMSNFYLCDYCAAHHWTTEDGLFVCESRPFQLEKVAMVDHHGKGGIRYRKPEDVCGHYEPKEDG